MSSFVSKTTHPLIHKVCMSSRTSGQLQGVAASSKQCKLRRKKVDRRNKNEGLYIYMYIAQGHN